MSLRTLKAIFGAVTVCFLVASAYIAVLVTERQKVLDDITHYNPAWQASQAVSEFMRLERRLDAFNVPGRGVDKDEVELRFDILLSRAKLLSEGRFQSIIQDDPDQQTTLRRLADVLVLVQPLMAELERPGSVQQTLQLLEPLEPRLLQLASYAQIRGGERIAQDQQELNRLYWIFSGLSLGLILLGLILIGLFSRHNQLLQRAHRDLHALTGHLAHAASHDALTELANRVLFHKQLEMYLGRWRQEGIQFAVLATTFQGSRTRSKGWARPFFISTLGLGNARESRCALWHEPQYGMRLLLRKFCLDHAGMHAPGIAYSSTELH